MLKICVCLPNDGEMSTETTAMINGLLVSPLECVCEVIKGSCIEENRNHLVIGKNITLTHRVDSSPEPGFSHFLMIDGDVSIEDAPTVIQEMISIDEPIVGIGYPMRGAPSRYCAQIVPEGANDLFSAASVASNVPVSTERGLIPVTWAGGGLKCVQRHVYESLEYPWYRKEWIDRKDAGGRTTHRAQTPEDVGFCMYAAENGIDTQLMVGYPTTHPTKEPEKPDNRAKVIAELNAHELGTLEDLHNLEHSVHYYTKTLREMIKRGIR